jgi:hypothetical protein
MKSLSHLQVGNEDDAEDVFDMNISGSEGDGISAEEEEPEDKNHSVCDNHLSI